MFFLRDLFGGCSGSAKCNGHRITGVAISKYHRKAFWILGSIFLFEGFFVVLIARPQPLQFLSWMGFLPGRHTANAYGWLAGLIVAIAYIAASARRLPSVRANLIRPSWLKLLAVCTAIATSILEEIAFRSMLMDSLRDHGAGAWLQVLLSGISFGLLHGIWALFRGSWRIGLGAVIATGLLGTALAVVYLMGGRSLAPCVTAHFLLSALAEPGLVLAAVGGEMGQPLTTREGN